MATMERVRDLVEKRVVWRELTPMTHLEVITEVRSGLPGQAPSIKNDATDRGFEDWDRAVQRMRRVVHILGCRECLFELRHHETSRAAHERVLASLTSGGD